MINRVLLPALIVALCAAAKSFSAGLTNVFNFTEETKIHGGFVEINGVIYATAEKGGENNLGYLGKFDPAAGTLTPLVVFTNEVKIKGGFFPHKGELLFLAEKGAPSNQLFGWLGKFNPTNNQMILLHEFISDLKAKSGFTRIGDDLWFSTEKGGNENLGSIQKWPLAGGQPVLVASLNTALGLKVEDLDFDPFTQTLYYGAREGGDLTQAGGKGAGSLGKVDVPTGSITHLLNFHNVNHGSKIRSLTWRAGKLWFALEEGADMTLFGGKGGGSLMCYDPANGTVTRVHIFDGANTGVKPRSFGLAQGEFYFCTEAGGANSYGAFGVLRNGTNVVKLSDLTAELGSKPDFYLSSIGNRIYFSAELGGSGFLGSILAYELDVPPRLAIGVGLNGNKRLTWPTSATGYVLISSPSLQGPWETVDSSLRIENEQHWVEVESVLATEYFRLRK